jgi:hypothetical protein
VVERKTTASYWASVSAVNAAESSVQSTAIPSPPAISQIAVRPGSIDSCRNPVVSEYTSTFSSAPSVASSQAAPTAGSSVAWACADAGSASSMSTHSSNNIRSLPVTRRPHPFHTTSPD